MKAAVCYTFSNMFTKAFGFLTIPLYTNLLTTGEYGYLNSYNAWISILSVITGLSLSSAIVSVQKNDEIIKNKYQSSVLTLSIVSFLLICSIFTISYYIIFKKNNYLGILAFIQAFSTFVLNFILQEWVLDNKYVKYSLLSSLSSIVPIIITCFIIRFADNKRYLYIILPKTFLLIVVMVFIISYILKRGKVLYQAEYWKQSLRYCFPIVFHSLSLSIMLQADRIMLSLLYSYEESGVYSFYYNITLVIGVLVAALENTWKAWFFKAVHHKTVEEINRKAKTYLLVAIIGIILFIYISPEVIRLLSSSAYWNDMYLTAPIAMAYIISFMYDFLVYFEYYSNDTKKIAYASICAAMLNILLNLFVLKRFGGFGASITTLLSYLLQFLLHLHTVHRIEKEIFTIKLFFPFIIISILMICLYLFVYQFLLIRYIIIVIFTIIMLFYLRNGEVPWKNTR